MRYSVYDPPKQEGGIAVNNQCLLTVDDPYSPGRRKYAIQYIKQNWLLQMYGFKQSKAVLEVFII